MSLRDYGIFEPARSQDFFFGDKVFTSPNMTFLPSSVPPPEPLPAVPSPAALVKQVWADDRYPYIPFIFDSAFFGPLMSRFSVFGKASLVEGSRGWHLPHNVGKEWKLFEKSLRFAVEAFQIFLKAQYPHIDCIWVIPEKPSHYGFFETHASQDLAYTAVKESIDAFVVYMAYLSFLVGLLQALSTDWQTPSLLALLEQAHIPVHGVWAQDLYESGVGNIAVKRRRIGTFVDIPNCRWRNLIPYMMKSEIPFWFYWGSPPFPPDVSVSWASLYRPNPFARPPGWQRPPPPVIPPGFPPVEPNSGQRPGELMAAFFTRRAEQNRVKEAKETNKEKQSRNSRLMQNGKKGCPGTRGARVFKWEDVDGVRIRQTVARREVEGVWELYSSCRIKYDSFHNEFDVCSEFEDGDKHEISDDEDDEDGDDSPPFLPHRASLTSACRPHDAASLTLVLPLPVSSTESGPLAHPPPTSLGQPLSTPPQPPILSRPTSTLPGDHCITANDDMAGITVADEMTGITTNDEMTGITTNDETTGITVNDERVGITANDTVNDETAGITANDETTGITANDEMDDDDVFNFTKQDVLARNLIPGVEQPPPKQQFIEDLVYYRYGFSMNETSYQAADLRNRRLKNWHTTCRAVGGQHLDYSSKANQQPIMDFLNILANSSRPFHEVPGQYWDLSPGNHAPLGHHECLHLRIELKQFGSESLCLLHPRGLESSECPQWILAVPPMTALECIRRQLGPDPYQLAEYFVANGMEFRTLQRLSSDKKLEPRSTSSGPKAPRRPVGYQFDLADFSKYQTARDTYLESYPCARRALSVGGILARLAREVLPVSAILAGPSQDALDGNQDILVCNGEIFVDDGLSEETKKMLGGTYEQQSNGKLFYLLFSLSLIIFSR